MDKLFLSYYFSFNINLVLILFESKNKLIQMVNLIIDSKFVLSSHNV